MGEPRSYCHPAPEGCCLDLHETVLVLVALIIVVQLALKLATVICYYVCHCLGTLFGTIFAKEPEKLTAATPKVKKAYPRPRGPWIQWSDQEVPRRRRQESNAPTRHCVHCTLEPVKVTMNLCKQAQNEHLCRDHQRAGRRPHPDYPPCQPHQCYNCDCENKYRQRTSSAPAAYTVTRCRDVACGTSDPVLVASGKERRPIAVGADPYPRTQVGESQYQPTGPSQEVEYPGGTQRSRRPTKVYIYPVHPQTPPGSRSASPERAYRRRGVPGSSQEEPQDYETREQRRKSRDVERQSAGVPRPSRFRDVATSVLQGMAAQQDSPYPKQRHYWPEQQAAAPADWVYQPLK